MSFPYHLFILFWAACVLGSIAFLLYPRFRNRATKAATVRFGNQLQQAPALGETFAQTLQELVGWIELDMGLHTKHLSSLISRLPSQVGDFFIHYRQRISEDRYLLVTTVTYSQHDERATVFGPSPSYPVTRLTYNLNFVIRPDALNKRIVVLSDPYATLIDKNLRADFAATLLKMVQVQLG